MQLTDITAIKSLCARHDFVLSKGFGQNFIVNAGICPKIVKAAGIDKSYGVLEIGPGIGVLTKELAASAAKVVAVEIDTRLPPLLEESLAECDNVKIVVGDVLKLDLAALLKTEFAGLKIAVCANLPYYITSPIIMKLLEDKLPIEHLTVMVQKEAADRLSAQPGTRVAGAITYAVHYYAQPRTLFSVQPGSFYPPPRVTSAVIQLRLHKTPPVAPKNEALMFRTVRAAFCQRRKTAANSISAGLSLSKADVQAALAAAGISATARPEELTLAQYAALSDAIGSAQDEG